jgi:flagellar hook assembly protein FlgD
LEIHDVAGRRIRTLVDGFREAGAHSVNWNGQDVNGARVPAGVYLYVLKTGGIKESRKMLLVD